MFSTFRRANRPFFLGCGPIARPAEELAALTYGDGFAACALRCFLALDDLQSSLKWKWWAKGGGFKPDKARQTVLTLWGHFVESCALFGLDFPALKSTYMAKNRVNFRRQNQQYNEDTKTEEDNRSIGA
jgi:hypothetical protein